jgi:hypothetical protein
MYMTFTAFNANVSANLTSLKLVGPTSSDLSYDTNWFTKTDFILGTTSLVLGYALKIKKETGSNTAPTDANGHFGIEAVNAAGTAHFFSSAPFATQGNILSTTIAIRGNTAAPWNMRTAGLSQAHYQVRDAGGTLVGEMDSGVWYYKFQNGQDATGYGAGGGGAVKGTGNFPWDGKTWQVHGGNGAPGLVIVEAYSV